VAALADGGALTRRAEVNSELRRAIAKSKGEQPAPSDGDGTATRSLRVGSDPAATQPMKVPSAETVTGPMKAAVVQDPASSNGDVVVPAGPRLVKRMALVATIGVAAAAGAHFLYRRMHPPPPPHQEVVVNLDTPVAETPPPDPDPQPGVAPQNGKRHRRKIVAAATGNPAQPIANAPVNAPQPQSPVLDPWAKNPVAQPVTPQPPPVAPPPVPNPPPVANNPPPANNTVNMPEELDNEEAPPTEAELKEQAQAAAFADNIRFVLRAHRAQVVACYERAFKDEGTSPGGKVVVDFTIATDGKAHKIRTSSNTTSKDGLGKCLEQRVAEWDFPKPTSDFATSYPFVFSAGG
jgi:hypothetical protein